MRDEDFRAQIDANFYGVVNVTKAALPILHGQRRGHFIQFSSIGGRVGGSPGLAAYQSAKFAVEGFSEVLVNEVRPLGIKVTIIEPGGFRTDWGGASMRAPAVGADYDQTVGGNNRAREATVDHWRGDPARAARIIVDVVGLDDPPLRLLLGAGAVESAAKASKARAEEAESWAETSRSADFPPDE
jgi:NAD(P)-dependent dehydrogenase (short-subunit alcohol dehydrogenase family)